MPNYLEIQRNLGKKYYIFLKLFILPKNTRISNHKIDYSFFFQKKIFGNTHIFTKCIDNIKFFISLKSYGE